MSERVPTAYRRPVSIAFSRPAVVAGAAVTAVVVGAPVVVGAGVVVATTELPVGTRRGASRRRQRVSAIPTATASTRTAAPEADHATTAPGQLSALRARRRHARAT